eukprot:CAMPEP_0183593408 /NCGR_PEP_ID=MMETSP0371-20130417/169754_1 /TAXON_ID=268820 /ORGANISM="Peridinium aciculiferum, Strain PAER-2" /LENGTH=92 /DNA_ID=CAMNT_0025805019 /DNA_START=55 /DNA_END=329 /DNA_ORIENTATION=-
MPANSWLSWTLGETSRHGTDKMSGRQHGAAQEPSTQRDADLHRSERGRPAWLASRPDMQNQVLPIIELSPPVSTRPQPDDDVGGACPELQCA